MKIAGLVAASLLSCAAFGGQAKNLPEPGRLATFLAATKNAVVSQSVVGNLSAEISQDWPTGGEKKTRAAFWAIVARDPGNPSVKFGGMKVDLTVEAEGRKTNQVVYLDGDKLADFESALEGVVQDRPRETKIFRDRGGKYGCAETGATNDGEPQVGVPTISPLHAGWCIGPAGYRLILQSPGQFRSYWFPGVPLERFVEIVAAARAYIEAH